MTGPHNVHATGIVLGTAGVMLRGPSGAGKSLLALELLDRWEADGHLARLVADDRLELAVLGARLVMRAPAAIVGLIELRGRGIVTRPSVAEAPVDLVVDLVDSLERMPEADDLRTQVLGIAMERCPVPRGGVVELAHQVLLVREALRALGAASMREKTT